MQIKLSWKVIIKLICSYRSEASILLYSLCRTRRDINTLFASVSADYLSSRAAVNGLNMVSVLADPKTSYSVVISLHLFPNSLLAESAKEPSVPFSIILFSWLTPITANTLKHMATIYILQNFFNIYGSDSSHPSNNKALLF